MSELGFNGIHGVTYAGFQRKEDSDEEAQCLLTCACGYEAWDSTWTKVGLEMDCHLEGKQQ